MDGTMTLLMTAICAVAEPRIEASMRFENKLTNDSSLGTRRNHTRAAVIRRPVMPPSFMISPSRMNNGIANRP